MSQSDRAIKKFATQLARLDREVKSWRGAQADFTSVEDGGNFTFKDSDGNVTAIMGGQDDGSNTIRHVDGPIPPIPSGLTAHVDGPIVQVSWDGTFEGADNATYDWSHLEVIAVGPGNEQLTATINDVTGASTNLAATASGEWTVVARSVSRAEKRSLDGDAGTVTVEVVDLSGAIEAAIGSANGKNTVHYSEVPPTPADEGVLGDTWFVNQVNPETGTMLITEQWQYVTEWVQTELNHQVIATVDLGKATVGELDGIRIMGQTIRGEQLSGDAIDGKVITGATYRTSGGNGSWSDAGLFIAQPDGTSMVRFPTDGSPLSLTASDTQIERASIADLNLSYGAVRSGGEFTLASGVTAPTSPPELTTGWQKLCTLPKPSERSDYANLAYWSNGNQWVRAINVLGAGEGDRVELYDAATGEVERSFPIDCDPRNGLTVMGDIVYVFGGDHGAGNAPVIDGYNLVTGVRVSRHSYTRAIQAKNALGNDGTNLIVASVYNRELWVHKRNPTTGDQVGSDMRSGSNSWPASGGKDLFGVRISGNDVEVVTAWGGRVYLNSNNALVRKTDTANESGYAGWVLPAHDVAGMVMKVGRFGAVVPFVVDGAGNVHEGSQFTSDTPAVASFTWYDGTNETTPSPEVSGFFSAREAPAFSTPTRAGLQKRLYFKFGTGDWNRVTLPETLTVLSWMDALNYTPVSAAPPATNSFPNADPAILKSTNDTFEVKGDGSGHWGPLTFNADGTMTGIPRTAAGRNVEMIAPSGGGIVDKAITFPPGRFTTPPAVTIGSHSTASTLYNIGVSGVTKDGFILSVNRANNTPTFVDWIATEII